jgi:hypothetical protein
MRRSGTILIYVMVWISVLFASFVIGICVREVRFHRARTAVAAKPVGETTKPKAIGRAETPTDAEKLAQELAEKAPGSIAGGERMEGRPARSGAESGRENMRRPFGDMSEEERTQMRERLENMSDEERSQFIRERMGSRRRGRFQNMSEEERAQMQERRRQMRERFENMTEEERQAFREEMRGRFGGRRPGVEEGGGRRPGDRQNIEQQEEN